MKLMVICAWCWQFIGFKELSANRPPKNPITHGIYAGCKRELENEIRDSDLLAPVIEALIDQRERTGRKSGYVFLDIHKKPLTTDHMREVIWKPALEKAWIEYRPMMQTRHTFATISLSEGENIGWVQHMLGHSSLQMIITKYYPWIPKRRETTAPP
jgi:integrase